MVAIGDVPADVNLERVTLSSCSFEEVGEEVVKTTTPKEN